MRKNRLKFDVSFYAVTLLAILLGYLNEYVILAFTIIVHECGHLTMAFFYKWRLEELKFFAFGGIMQFEGELNKSNVEDFMISIGGVVFNIIAVIILLLLRQCCTEVLHLKFYDYAISSQLFVIAFNLIPLPPLDGSRILSSILCFFMPFKHVLHVTVIINTILIAIITVVTILYDIRQVIVIVSFLTFSTLKYNSQIQYLFQRFLLQKRMYENIDLPRKTVKISSDSWENEIYRGFFNLFQVKNRLNDEMKYLKLKYEKKQSVIIDAKIKTD